MALRCRRADNGDKPALLELMAKYYAFDGHEFDVVKASRSLDALLADERLGAVWMIEVAGELAGYMVMCIGYSLEFGGRDAFLDEIYLEAPWRGQGFGREAVAHMISEARKLGIVAMHLEVDQDNARARRLYEALGFRQRGRFQLFSRAL